jgi:hypothetical protein
VARRLHLSLDSNGNVLPQLLAVKLELGMELLEGIPLGV